MKLETIFILVTTALLMPYAVLLSTRGLRMRRMAHRFGLKYYGHFSADNCYGFREKDNKLHNLIFKKRRMIFGELKGKKICIYDDSVHSLGLSEGIGTTYLIVDGQEDLPNNDIRRLEKVKNIEKRLNNINKICV